MKCPQCGFTGSDEATACRKCGKDLGEARRALGLRDPDRTPRAATRILEGPVDPSLIDDSPLAPEKPTPTSILDLGSIPGDPLDGDPFDPARGEETDLEEILAGSDPIEAAEITAGARPARRDTPDVSPHAAPEVRANAPGEAPADEVMDFGEPLELAERPAPVIQTMPAVAAGAASGWSGSQEWPADEWEGLESDIGIVRDPRAVPKGGFWLRVVASMADSIFIQIVSSMAFFVVATGTGALGAMSALVPQPGADPAASAAEIESALLSLLQGPLGWTFAALVVLASLYRPVCHWRWGKTVGKKLVGLRLVTTEGKPVGFIRACWRDVAYLLASLPLGLGLLWVAWDPQKQGWHDKLAGTYVFKENA